MREFIDLRYHAIFFFTQQQNPLSLGGDGQNLPSFKNKMLKSIGIAGAFGAFGLPVLAVVGVGAGLVVVGAGAGFLLAGAKGALTGTFLASL